MRAERVDDESRGAYGLRVAGLGAGVERLLPAPAEWPLLELDRPALAQPGRPTAGSADREHATVVLGDEGAVIRLALGGRVRLERDPARATFRVRGRLTDEEVLHPHLGGIASVYAHWSGRIAFHAGAVEVDGGAWGVLGDRRSGKSSLLAQLGVAGKAIVCDDVLVVDGRHVFAGPRFVDLREDAADRLGVGEALGVVGARARWRLPLGAVEPVLPLRGWLVLAWSERGETEVTPIRPERRLPVLAGARTLWAPLRDPAALLALAALPMLELSRPRDWVSAARVADAIAGAVAAS